jgi:hypothetical protein
MKADIAVYAAVFRQGKASEATMVPGHRLHARWLPKRPSNVVAVEMATENPNAAERLAIVVSG